MNRNPIIGKGLAVGIILLFVGTCIIPATAQDTEEISSSIKRVIGCMLVGVDLGISVSYKMPSNHAYDGDTIFVFNGTYNEHITIDKQINLIGEDRETYHYRWWLCIRYRHRLRHRRSSDDTRIYH